MGKSSTDLLELCQKCDWELLGETRDHKLYRTRSGGWITVPIGEAELSSLLKQEFYEVFQLDVEILVGEAKGLMRRSKGYLGGGLLLIGIGLVLMLITLFNVASKSPEARSSDSRFVMYLVLAALVLAPLAFWLGKSKIGPHMHRRPEQRDRPLRRLEFTASEFVEDNSS